MAPTRLRFSTLGWRAVEPDAGAVMRRESTFADGVGDVLRLRADEQMFRIDAARVVAVMRHDQTGRHLTVREHPGDPMRVGVSSRGVDLDLPVAVTPDAAALELPAVTRIWAFDRAGSHAVRQ